jgi:hypothetical protein
VLPAVSRIRDVAVLLIRSGSLPIWMSGVIRCSPVQTPVEPNKKASDTATYVWSPESRQKPWPGVRRDGGKPAVVSQWTNNPFIIS